MTIGQNIRALRKKRGLTQKQLAERCGITGGAISSYENGATIPKRRVVERIARALDVPVEKIMDSAAPVIPRGNRTDGDTLLYDGVLTVLRELYGIVEGRVILGENGASKKYYVVRQIPDDFVLYESDIAAIAQSAKASLPPMVEYMRRVRGERP